jgi:hypothetical protein
MITRKGDVSYFQTAIREEGMEILIALRTESATIDLLNTWYEKKPLKIGEVSLSMARSFFFLLYSTFLAASSSSSFWRRS